MADFYTNQLEENLIDRVRKEGFGYKQPEFGENDFPKYLVLRVALARALRMEKIPLDSPLWQQRQIVGEKNSKRSEYHLAQLTGKGKERRENFDITFRALFYIRHKDELQGDVFASDELYLEILEKYIRRGLYELYNSWKNDDSIYQWGIDNLGFENLALQSMPKSSENSNESWYFNKLKHYYKDFGVNINLIREYDSYRHHICKIEVSDANSLPSFEARARFLDNEFGKSVLVSPCDGIPRAFDIQIAKDEKDWKFVLVNEFKAGLAKLKSENLKLGIYAGQDVDKKPFCFDLQEVPHCFVSGGSGGGKSVFVKGAILCLLQNKNVEICVLVAQKGTDFMVFGEKIRLIYDFEGVKNELESLVAEMEARYSVMNEARSDDFIALGFKYKIVIIDELKDLITQENKKNQEISTPIGRLAQKGRAAGIHLILATQSPDGHSFKGAIRSNIHGRIAFKVPKLTDSKIILDESGAQKLLGKGDMLLRVGAMTSPKRLFGAYLSDDEIKSLI
ncbi:FtsK/SpoIIIE domain-containing protein [Campylobacter troglodytis]|uniref:FtsK/SpoIIIE domain-containing protein n=1 Tax=Campylobacter troglodytis TaxID=654363 RepID=UPI00115A8706|nr:FtsK/SpoIIIE domain-containing protein [Campylobacter troglodytis]TQR60949.1 cell division protein FtsK [Campylobacter troglodytis]